MNKRWVLTETDEQAVDELYESLRINRILCKLLVQRGVKTFEDAKKFFRPSLETHLYNPLLMMDMDKAVERIDRAMQKKEKILVYGDYDVDGTTAVAVLYGFIKDLYFYVDYYVPDRTKEGYGVSVEGINWAKERGFSLIIAVDCGIKANEQVAYAKSEDIDFIICDHHRPGEELPDAVAVLDPKRHDCQYPFKELSGCGIAFKLVQAMAAAKQLSFKKVTRYLDLVVVSIAADIVPIIDENRVLAYYGLRQLNRNPRPGLRSLMELNPINRELSISDIVYIIAPRINAAGRMDDARHAVRLLLSQEGASAKKNAGELQVRNMERKIIDMGITEEALLMVENDPIFHHKKTTVLYKPDWHKGVIGIVASRLIERYFKPTIVLTATNNIVSGSARSVPGFDIYNAIKACSDLLDQFGGHKYAAGLTMKAENLHSFIDRFEAVVADTIDESMLVPEIQIDAELPLKDINTKFFNIIQQFAPFGPGNTRPVFVCEGVSATKWTSIVGNNHLKLYLKQEGSPVVKGIAYNMGNLYEAILSGKTFDVCFTLEENKHNNNIAIQVNVRDVKF
ncbi:MAG TPA: single-stranded-DNA-specific exonuclease RecJ [Chitinophagales bacterium]|nr:single-stranded-DNA-specific exonuclease RecJ [Chitinophagales bacterium]HRK26184.1 single-stranded-DNA-specific exonuclease RecJ [Chitinophagales bacterium]